MTTTGETEDRQPVAFADSERIDQLDPAKAANVQSIKGVRIYDVGQGDAIAVLDQDGKPFLQIDYGGKVSSPFHAGYPVGTSMPVTDVKLVMLTHWDEDHWCSSPENPDTYTCPWLVPRQITSPRAVLHSIKLNHALCIPESKVGSVESFIAGNGDRVLFQKIGRMPDFPYNEDCNRTGVAFAVVNDEENEVILLPGDAPFHRIPLYAQLQSEGMRLRGLVAYHHGSKAHWTRATDNHLAGWQPSSSTGEIVYSFGSDNTYRHPQDGKYKAFHTWSSVKTPALRGQQGYWDILF